LANTQRDDVSGVGNNFWTYNESSSDWDFIDPGTELTVMKGYNVYVYTPLDKTSTFTGTINTGSCSINTTAIDGGWNMVGNPYPSAIDWDASSGWTKTNINDAIYFMKSDGNFASYVLSGGVNGGTQYIPAMQGVFVFATGSGSLGVTNEVRVHNSQAYWKNNKTDFPTLKLTAKGNDYSDEMILRFCDDASDKFDGTFDAFKKFTQNESIPQIYSITNSNDSLSINTLPKKEEEVVVQVGFCAGESGTYEISFNGISTFHPYSSILFEDKKENILVDIQDISNYSFEYSLSDSKGRFLLHFSDQYFDVNELDDKKFNIYSHKNSVYIQSGDINDDYSIEIYNMYGKLIHFSEQVSSSTKIDLNVSSGYYIAKVASDSRVYKNMVFID